MKTISVRDLQQKIRQTVQAAQKDKVVITRHGQPAAIVIGVEGYDWEDVFWATSPSFWKMIQQRRKEKGIPWDRAKKLLKARWAGRKRRS
jgi:prevent-host-death family protein